MKFYFTKGKKYNVKQVNDWFNKISNPSLSNTEQNNNNIEMLSLFEFCYIKFISDDSYIF
jgi:hypothetical protein